MTSKNSFPDNAEEINLDFYNKNADFIYKQFRNLDKYIICNKFLGYLPQKAHILDLGCGVGTYTKHFLEKGHQVTAIDGSQELVKYARQYTNHAIFLMKFNELQFKNEFDGIWAAASLLHINRKDFPVFLRDHILPFLKCKGFLYMSFKYGNGENFFNGRYFCDYNEKSLRDVVKNFNNLKIIETCKTENKLSEDKTIAWFHCIIQKVK